MNDRLLRCLALAGILFGGGHLGFACSWAPGYFYQVTGLRGIVVGMDNYWPLLGYHSYPRWLRQRAKRGNATLRLYKYRWPRGFRESQPVAETKSDRYGKSDFGSLPGGHYALVIDCPEHWGDIFDVEIKKLPAETESVKIDVSPVNPDCSGGHEFIRYSK
jgi:hypothetical protein